jgi:hypothetical protein
MNSTTTPMIQPSYPVHHMGVERVERGLTTARQMLAVLTPSRTLLLTGLIASTALSVAVADALLGTWGDEHLLMTLGILAVVAVASGFLLLPLLAALVKSSRLMARRLLQRRQINEREAQFWNAAVEDPRMMRELETLAALQAGDFGCAAPAAQRQTSSVWATVWQQWSQRRAKARADAYTWACAQQDPRLMADLDAALSRPHLR